jgi:hypothetical protein
VNNYQFGTCIPVCNLLDPCGCKNDLRCTMGPDEGYAHCQDSYGYCFNGVPTTTTPNTGGSCSAYWDCIASAVCLEIPPVSAVCTAACDATHPCTDPTKSCMTVGVGGQSRITYSFCL